MASRASITRALERAPIFTLNGCTNRIDEPYKFLDEAHALALCLEEAASDNASMSNEVLQAAARGVATLIHMAAQGLAVMDAAHKEAQ